MCINANRYVEHIKIAWTAETSTLLNLTTNPLRELPVLCTKSRKVLPLMTHERQEAATGTSLAPTAGIADCVTVFPVDATYQCATHEHSAANVEGLLSTAC